MNILVTNAKSRITYNIVKNLALKGHRVFCANSFSGAMTFYSRYCSGYFIYPSPFSGQKDFVDMLIYKIKKLKIDILIPVFEELFLISKYKNEIEKHVKIAIPDYSKVLIAHNKNRWQPIAMKLGIPVPNSYSIFEFIEKPAKVDQLQFPVLFKPKQGGGGWGISRIDSVEVFREILKSGSYYGLPFERFFVQEIISGETLCVAMIFSHGQFRGKTCYRQIREYPVFNGQATCRLSVANKEAEDYLQQLLEYLQWHGVCQVDFIIDNNTGKPYLIDINPRFWGSLVQGIASGVDFPNMICEIAAKGDVPIVESFSEGVQTRWLGGELCGFVKHFNKAEKKTEFLKDFFMPINKTKQLDDFSWNDPIPFFVWSLASLLNAIKFKKTKKHDSLMGEWE
ncbi:MAG: ATP-grasp domain-containing protein [Pedobacter sp.]